MKDFYQIFTLNQICYITKPYFYFFFSVTRIVPKSTFIEIDRGARLILGQRQDSTRLDFDPERSFSGRYTEVMLWRGELVLEEIKSLSNCKRVSTKGIILDWNINAFDGSQVDVEEVDLHDLCKPGSLRGKALFNIGASFDEFR